MLRWRHADVIRPKKTIVVNPKIPTPLAWSVQSILFSYFIFAARRTLEEYLRRESPETWRVLEDPDVAFHYTAALQFGFSSKDEDVFERLTMPESLEILKGVAQAANYSAKLTLGRGTKEVLIEATRSNGRANCWH